MSTKKVSMHRFKQQATPYLLIAPALIFVLGVLGYSVGAGIVMSFFRIDMRFTDRPFIGFENYVKLFNSPDFINSLTKSLIFVLVSIVLGVLLSIVFSLSLHRCSKFGNFFKGLALVPYLISGIATAIMFRFIFHGGVGLVNMILEQMGLDRILFLSNANWALVVVILANVWFVVPFSVLILLAGLQGIDQEIYEACDVDGASKRTVFFKITLPLISPMMGISLVWLSFASFNMFDVVLPLTGGGPAKATEVLAVHMYKIGFEHLRYSEGSAVMAIILLFNVATSLFFLKVFKAAE